jgi:hypothetical protein
VQGAGIPPKPCPMERVEWRLCTIEGDLFLRETENTIHTGRSLSNRRPGDRDEKSLWHRQRSNGFARRANERARPVSRIAMSKRKGNGQATGQCARRGKISCVRVGSWTFRRHRQRNWLRRVGKSGNPESQLKDLSEAEEFGEVLKSEAGGAVRRKTAPLGLRFGYLRWLSRGREPDCFDVTSRVLRMAHRPRH